VKAFLSGVFKHALQNRVITGQNPMDNTKAGGKDSEFEPHAYTLAELKIMFKSLPEPAKTVCAVAAFTGLRASELRGLRRQDYDGEILKVRQKVWRRHIGQPKTPESRGDMPVIPELRKILDHHLKTTPENDQGFIFAGEKTGFALDLHNLSRRVISPLLNDGWFDWHAFRRGLATRLHEMNVDAKTIQAIMRHADVTVTMAYYVLPNAEKMKQAMAKEAVSSKEVFNAFWGSKKPKLVKKTA
jgi:integrase